MYLLKLAMRPWRLAPFSQVLTSVAVGVLLLLVGFMFWLQDALKPVILRLQNEQVITAYLNPELEGKDEQRLVDTIKTTLGAKSTTEIKVVDEKQFIQRLKRQYPDLSRELEDLGSEIKSIIPRYVSISGILAESDLERVRAISGIESAESSKERHRHVVGAFSVLRWLARVLGVGLCLALATGLIHLSRMNAYLHQEAMSLLKLWGGGAFALRAPGMISGLSVGALGGAFAWLGWISGGNWVTVQIRELSPLLKDISSSAHGMQVALALLAAGMILGLLAGTVGTLAAAVRASDGRR